MLSEYRPPDRSRLLGTMTVDQARAFNAGLNALGSYGLARLSRYAPERVEKFIKRYTAGGKQSSKRKMPAKSNGKKRYAATLADPYLYNRKQTVAQVKNKRKKRKVKKKPAFSKREKRSIKRIADNGDYKMVRMVRNYSPIVLRCDFNKVSWSNVWLNQAATNIAGCVWKIRLPDKGGTDPDHFEEVKIDTTTASNQKVKIDNNVKVKVHNNSNECGELRMYMFQCTDYTNDQPFDELVEMRKTHFGTATPVDITNDFNQYYGAPPGQKYRNWKMIKEVRMDMKGGEVSETFFDMPKYTFNVGRWIDAGKTTYVPGLCVIKGRLEGALTHSKAARVPALAGVHPGIYDNLCKGSLQLDIERVFYQKYYVRDGGDAINKYADPVIGTLFTPTDIATDVPVAADPEQVGVGPPTLG